MSVVSSVSAADRARLDRAWWRATLASVSVVTVTPFGGERLERIDHAGLARNLRWLRDKGVELVVAGGNTGEFAALSPAEAVAVVGTHVRAFEGPVIAGIGYRLDEAIQLGREAMSAGAAALLVHQPIHPYASEDGLVRYYASLAEILPAAPLVIYVRSRLLTRDGIRRIGAIESVVGVKVSVPDVEWFGRLRDGAPELAWVCGLAERWAVPFWQAGAIGFTSGIANFRPDRSRMILDALKAGDVDVALALARDVLALEELRSRHADTNNVAVIKAAMEISGLTGGGLRPPLSELSAQDRAELEWLMRKLDVAS